MSATETEAIESVAQIIDATVLGEVLPDEAFTELVDSIVAKYLAWDQETRTAAVSSS